MPVLRHGAMIIRVSIMAGANTPEMKMAMAFGEVHVNTMEGFWSLLRSWLRPHRGISQEKLPLYLGSSSSCTTCASGVKRYLVRSLSYWSHKPTVCPSHDSANMLSYQ